MTKATRYSPLIDNQPSHHASGTEATATEISISVAVASVPLAWWLGWLSMRGLYLVAFVIGAVNTTAGSAAQIVLTQIVPRERLVEAHAKNALASSTAEVTGPGDAGA